MEEIYEEQLFAAAGKKEGFQKLFFLSFLFPIGLNLNSSTLAGKKVHLEVFKRRAIKKEKEKKKTCQSLDTGI